ncbi:MAG: hypothetical protein ACHQCF_00935 [Solirubrobacterales bacterium]
MTVSIAAAALLGGFLARDKTAETVAYQLTGAQPHMIPGSITSVDIKNGSLLYKDFKPGQVLSQKQADSLFVKDKTANSTFLKIDDATAKYLGQQEAANTYLKIEDANNRFVNGDGKVLTGFGTSNGNLIGLLDIAGIASVQGDHVIGKPDTVHIVNTGGSLIDYAMNGSAGTIAIGGTLDVDVATGQNGNSETIQLLVPAVNKIATLTVSGIQNPGGGATDFVAQCLVGGP